MDPKNRSNTIKPGGIPKPAAVVKGGKGIVETSRLFLDVEEMNRKSSMTQSLSRYVE